MLVGTDGQINKEKPDVFDPPAAAVSALEDWQLRAEGFDAELDVTVAAEVLSEALSADSGRFGHRSGSLTVSALEPMRAIPHKVIVLMGLDGQAFPRRDQRPGFHLLEQQRRLGDPRCGDQDRYVLLEALMSARQHLMISWCGRHEQESVDSPSRLKPNLIGTPAW